MIETYFFQVFRKHLALLTPYVTEVPPGIAFTIRGLVGDALYELSAERDAQLRADGRFLFGGWGIQRTYTPAEIAAAELFLVNLPMTHMAAEESGTRYDETAMCAVCGLGSRQVGEFRLPVSQLPKSRDLIQLWGGEIVIRPAVAEMLAGGGFSGWHLTPVRQRDRDRPIHQLQVDSSPLVLADTCRFGNSPFEAAGAICDAHKDRLVGGRQLSPLVVRRDSWDGSDLCWTREYVGTRGGLFRPYRLLMVSAKLFQVMRARKIRGWDFETVGLV